MKKYIAVIFLLAIASCGKPAVDVEVKGGVDPVVVEHKLQLDDIEKYFRYKCVADLEEELGYDPTEEEIQECIETNIGDFLQIIGDIATPTPSPSVTPTPTPSPEEP